MSETIRISCPCLFGLESVLAFEIKRLGVGGVKSENGRVSFDGTMQDIMRANIALRTAERVQIVLAEFRATTFEELFQGVLTADLERFIGKDDAFPVKGYSLSSKLHSVPDCQSIVKKAAVTRLEKYYHQSWFDETGPTYQIQFGILKDQVTLLLDTTGGGLYKRGYREESNLAPIRETLAAGILDLARARDAAVLVDPFCGSGTLLIEGAMRTMEIAPGLERGFSFESWRQFPKDEVEACREQFRLKIRRDADFKGFGFDLDRDAVNLTKRNAKRAQVAGIRAEQAPIDALKLDEFEQACVVCNPPYGERMLEVKEAEKIYRTMGKVFSERKGLRYFIITPHPEFEKLFGRRAEKRRKLYNGKIQCTLYSFG